MKCQFSKMLKPHLVSMVCIKTMKIWTEQILQFQITIYLILVHLLLQDGKVEIGRSVEVCDMIVACKNGETSMLDKILKQVLIKFQMKMTQALILCFLRSKRISTIGA